MARKRRRSNRKANNRLYTGIGNDLSKATETAEKYLPIQELPGVDASRAGETQNYLNSLQALADPTYASYAGARTPEMANYLGRLNESTAGYDSNELTALREQRRREMERGFSTGKAALARGQNRAQVGGVSRAAQLMELAKDYGSQNAAAENDLLVKGAEEKQRRLETYGNALSGEIANEFDRGQVARDAYGTAMKDAQTAEFEKQKVNMGQAAANQAIRSAGILGVLGIGDSRKNARRQNRLMRQAYGRNRSNSSSNSSGSSSSYADQLNQIAAGVANGEYY